jgi:hypothetical protein
MHIISNPRPPVIAATRPPYAALIRSLTPRPLAPAPMTAPAPNGAQSRAQRVSGGVR